MVGKGRSGVRTASVMRMLGKMDCEFAHAKQKFCLIVNCQLLTVNESGPPAGGVVGALPVAPLPALYIFIFQGERANTGVRPDGNPHFPSLIINFKKYSAGLDFIYNDVVDLILPVER